ncbi:MAG: alpha/beta hydrolase [Pseudomonadota bacterium]|uniref:alpha/beta hydrolase n=1 Tax=Polaromonas sp. TaxID=1869339 RepID=UPI0017F0AD94|nr:alpha/beta hydrolase [Polaromonas sp.]MBA3593779.1 alpha/beta hydrolase [Polaromonas sp.]MDQ3273410.1 alpha/beta hydrolase [Pseudomonadota bacterium]
MSSPLPAAWRAPCAPPPLDPQIVEYMQRMAAEGGRYPKRHTIPIDEGRANAERVRAPWTKGGPVMARTIEHAVPTRHGNVRIRVHYPETRTLRGALIYIHGGGFVLFSLDTHDRVMREYAGRAGIAVIGIDYTRAPEASFPQPLDECVDVMGWLADNAPALDIDPVQLFIGGDSAGANLSVGTCLTLRDEGRLLPLGMLLNYGVYSTDLYRESMARYGAGEYGLTLHMMVWFYGLYLRRPEDFSDPRLASIEARLTGLPPACLVMTECDPLHDDNLEMSKRLTAAGVPVQATLYPGTVHGFLEAVAIADVACRAFDDSVRWLATLAST